MGGTEKVKSNWVDNARVVNSDLVEGKKQNQISL